MIERLVFTPGICAHDSLSGRGWSDNRELLDPRNYITDTGVTSAINAALLLNKPLLFTGDPGSGKTQLAYKVAWELGLKPPLRFEAKSTTDARDLLYRFDHLMRLRDAQAGARRRPASSYLEFGPLGLAIVAASINSEDLHWVPRKELERVGQLVGIGNRAVVLIDEIDKAPRDVPNDLLAEIDELYFRVPEIGSGMLIKADQRNAPILIFTSNREVQLPEAFLRRCVYYHIDFPDADMLQTIVLHRLRFYEDKTGILQEATTLLKLLRQRFARPPGLVEFLDCLRVLSDSLSNQHTTLRAERAVLETALGVMVKNLEDRKHIPTVLDQWSRTNADAIGFSRAS